MKKSLIALAAFAVTGAFAQSSVTIYGQLDAGLYSLSKANGTDNAVVYGDGAVFSNVLGFKGSEDIGGGLKANFQAETDIQTNNGGLNQNGLFRRQANVSASSAAFGEIKLGLTTNPLIATNGLLMPVAGNSVSTATSSALGYADFYTKNAVTYFTPTIAGFSGVLQRGMSNNIESASVGSMMAYSLAYVQGPLQVHFAAQDRKQAAIGSANSGANASSASAAAFDKKTSILGAKYSLGAFTLGAAYLQNKAATAIDGPLAKVTGSQFGLGYVTGAWTLGTSLTRAEGSNLFNAQARYALSKRTNIIALYGNAKNDANGKVKFVPVAFNTGSSPATITDTFIGTAGKTQSALGLGITHSF